jgi:hypothetical protein
VYPHIVPEMAGWFPDPERPGVLRWWDGVAWTPHRQELPPPPSVGVPEPAVETALPQQQPLPLAPRASSPTRLAEIARARPGTRVPRESGMNAYLPGGDGNALAAEPGDLLEGEGRLDSPMTGEIWFMALLPLLALAAILALLRLGAFESTWYLGWLTVGLLLLVSAATAVMDRTTLRSRQLARRVPALLGFLPPLYLVARAAVVSSSSVLPLIVWLVCAGTATGCLLTVAPWVFSVPLHLL